MLSCNGFMVNYSPELERDSWNYSNQQASLRNNVISHHFLDLRWISNIWIKNKNKKMTKQESAIDIKVFYLKGMALESSSLSAACLHSCAAGKGNGIKSPDLTFHSANRREEREE